MIKAKINISGRTSMPPLTGSNHMPQSIHKAPHTSEASRGHRGLHAYHVTKSTRNPQTILPCERSPVRGSQLSTVTEEAKTRLPNRSASPIHRKKQNKYPKLTHKETGPKKCLVTMGDTAKWTYKNQLLIL